MNIKKVYGLLLAGFCVFGYAEAQTPLQAADFEQEKLARLILEKTDSVRRVHKLAAWEEDAILRLAAQDHANYLARHRELSHFQKDKKKYSPQDRVVYFGGQGYLTGENAAEHPIHVLLYKVSGQTIERVNSYEDSALLFVQQWISSPPHKKNMLNPAYVRTGIGVALDEKGEHMYAVQVFSPVPQTQ